MTAINSNRAIRGPVTAVPVVAGKGVKITADTVNNRFVAEVDETVLFDGTAATSVTCSESVSNFERIRVCIKPNPFTVIHEETFDVGNTAGYFLLADSSNAYGGQITATTTTVAITNGKHVWFNASGCGSEADSSKVVKVVGINRISASA